MWEITGGIASALVSAVIFRKLICTGGSESDKNNVLKIFVLSFVFYTATDVPAAFLLSRILNVPDTAAMIFFLNTMFLLAVKDIRQRIIPNSMVAVLIAVRFVSALLSGMISGDIRSGILSVLAGAAAGLIITGIAAVLPGKGLGAGDVKMYGAIGAYTGIIGVMDILIYTCLLCAAAGIILMALRKCSVRTFVPMAPFAYAGTLIYIIAGCVKL